MDVVHPALGAIYKRASAAPGWPFSAHHLIPFPFVDLHFPVNLHRPNTNHLWQPAQPPGTEALVTRGGHGLKAITTLARTNLPLPTLRSEAADELNQYRVKHRNP